MSFVDRTSPGNISALQDLVQTMTWESMMYLFKARTRFVPKQVDPDVLSRPVVQVRSLVTRGIALSWPKKL